jgi:hypothetical protein
LNLRDTAARVHEIPRNASASSSTPKTAGASSPRRHSTPNAGGVAERSSMFVKVLGKRHPFVVRSHPVRSDDALTLAWARLDIDFEEGEATIEEIQSDRVRSAESAAKDIREWIEDGGPADIQPDEDLDATPFQLLTYLERVLAQHDALWSEAMLSEALWFLRKELCIHRIYYHSHRSGLLHDNDVEWFVMEV